MGASFRSKAEVLELAGCDRLTISPGLLAELAADDSEVALKLNASDAQGLDIEKIEINEASFR